MKCPHCGADNPDSAFFCGRCSADLREGALSGKAGASTREPVPSMESLLSPRLLRIEENIRKRRERFLGRLRSPSRRWSVTFKSESEILTLVVEKDGHASIIKGEPQTRTLTLEGPHDAFVSMLSRQDGFGPIPDSVYATLGDMPMPDATSSLLVKEGVEKALNRILGR